NRQGGVKITPVGVGLCGVLAAETILARPRDVVDEIGELQKRLLGVVRHRSRPVREPVTAHAVLDESLLGLMKERGGCRRHGKCLHRPFLGFYQGNRPGLPDTYRNHSEQGADRNPERDAKGSRQSWDALAPSRSDEWSLTHRSPLR